MTAPRTPATAGDLRGAGLRVTAARVALLETVRNGNHLGIEEITSGVRARIGHISLQAVYDALHALTAAGLIRRLEPAASPGSRAAWGTTTTMSCAGRAGPSRMSTAPSATHPA